MISTVKISLEGTYVWSDFDVCLQKGAKQCYDTTYSIIVISDGNRFEFLESIISKLVD